jgi:hypothetical protein
MPPILVVSLVVLSIVHLFVFRTFALDLLSYLDDDDAPAYSPFGFGPVSRTYKYVLGFVDLPPEAASLKRTLLAIRVLLFILSSLFVTVCLFVYADNP